MVLARGEGLFPAARRPLAIRALQQGNSEVVLDRRVNMADQKKEVSFENSLARLEEIVSGMEEGSLSLDEMITQFEEGQKLIKFCTGKLHEVERKIEKLLSKEGPVETESFPPVDAPEADELPLG
jgi:exodeoxyribonuclease VII small subunit